MDGRGRFAVSCRLVRFVLTSQLFVDTSPDPLGPLRCSRDKTASHPLSTRCFMKLRIPPLHYSSRCNGVPLRYRDWPAREVTYAAEHGTGIPLGAWLSEGKEGESFWEMSGARRTR